MMRFNHQVHDGYEKEMAPSSDVNDTDVDTDEDESNNSIVHDPFDDHRLMWDRYPNLIFDSEDVILIFYRLSNFNKMSKATYLSLTLVSLIFLKLRDHKCFMFIAEKSPSVNFSSPVIFPPQNSNHDK